MDCLVTNQSGETVLKGEANLMPPTKKVRVQRIDAPQIQLYDPRPASTPCWTKFRGWTLCAARWCTLAMPARCLARWMPPTTA